MHLAPRDYKPATVTGLISGFGVLGSAGGWYSAVAPPGQERGLSSRLQLALYKLGVRSNHGYWMWLVGAKKTATMGKENDKVLNDSQ